MGLNGLHWWSGVLLSFTATRNNKTLCAVSLGSKQKNERVKTCTTLLDYGFKKFKNKN